MDHTLPPPTFNLNGQVHKDREENGLDAPYFDEGGFSEIYRGTWTDSSGICHKVAIKVFRGVHTRPKILQKMKERLTREVAVWKGLDHKNVLKFLGACDDRSLSPAPVLISPLCREGDILTYMEKHPEMNRPLMISQIAEGLGYLHSQEVVHGDMKSTNILVGDRGKPLICDFGRSRIMFQRGYTTTIAISARYMAPEFLNVQEHVDNEEPLRITKEADVYGFSMVGLEILTGDVPFSHIKVALAVIALVQQGLQPERSRCKVSASDRTWPILERCWVCAPSSRPTMVEVVQEISPIVL